MTRFFAILLCIASFQLQAAETLHLSDEATIPLFDLTILDGATAEEKELLVQEFGDALRDTRLLGLTCTPPALQQSSRSTISTHASSATSIMLKQPFLSLVKKRAYATYSVLRIISTLTH